MSEGSPLKEVAEGATKGGLEFLSEKIPELITRFRNRDIAFVKDRETILAIRKERESAGWTVVSKFLTDFDLRQQVQMGLTMRQIQNDKERLDELRLRISKRYGTSGLHVAELAEIGVVHELLVRLVTVMGGSTPDVANALASFLSHSESLTIFIHQWSKVEHIQKIAQIRLEGFEPHMIMIFAKGTMRSKMKGIIDNLSSEGYIVDTSTEGDQLIAFVYTPETRKKIVHWSDALTLDGMPEKKKPAKPQK